MRAYTLVIRATDAALQFSVSYEVVAADVESATRLALADMALRSERALDVEHLEIGAMRRPGARSEVRFRTGRAYFPG